MSYSAALQICLLQKAGTGISTQIKRSRVAAKELDGGSDLTPAMINEERAVAVEARN